MNSCLCGCSVFSDYKEQKIRKYLPQPGTRAEDCPKLRSPRQGWEEENRNMEKGFTWTA